mmetsp:Transcript_8433/g.21083  ORF Transcript_8433/g.21083 Transcript_8433/m.21083 type:complete len:270 (-) Transcript_8433:650-1459(-)
MLQCMHGTSCVLHLLTEAMASTCVQLVCRPSTLFAPASTRSFQAHACASARPHTVTCPALPACAVISDNISAHALAASADACACASANPRSSAARSAARSFWKRCSSSVMRATMVSYVTRAAATRPSHSRTSRSASSHASPLTPGVARSLASLTLRASRSPRAWHSADSAAARSPMAAFTLRTVRPASLSGASKLVASASARARLALAMTPAREHSTSNAARTGPSSNLPSCSAASPNSASAAPSSPSLRTRRAACLCASARCPSSAVT